MNSKELSKEPIKFIELEYFGILYIDDILINCDEPVLFTCYTNADQHFLVNCIDINAEYRKWSLVAVSKERLQKALRGNLSIYDVISRPESGFIFLINESYAGADTELSIDIINEHDITEDYLPGKNTVFSFFQDSSLSPFVNPINQASIEEDRDILQLTLQNLETNIHEAPIYEFTGILEKTWNSFKEILGKVEILPRIFISGFAPGSLTLRLKIDDKNQNLFSDFKDSSIAIRTFLKLVSSKNDGELTKSIIQSYKNTKIKKVFDDYLTFLMQINYKVIYEYASGQSYKMESIDKNEASQLKEVFQGNVTDKDEIKEIEGIIRSYNSDTGLVKFEQFTKQDKDKSFTAHLDASLKDTPLLVPSNIVGKFHIVKKRNLLSEEVEDTNTLLSIFYPNMIS